MGGRRGVWGAWRLLVGGLGESVMGGLGESVMGGLGESVGQKQKARRVPGLVI